MAIFTGDLQFVNSKIRFFPIFHYFIERLYIVSHNSEKLYKYTYIKEQCPYSAKLIFGKCINILLYRQMKSY